MTPPLFLFGGPQFLFPSTPYASLGERSTQQARPSATLTALERRALAALNDLGAGVDDTVSSFELRHAFRTLARQYHPDRHTGSGHVETARLSRLFAELTDHYRLLAAALDAGARDFRASASG
jgi:hypothetical protein